MAVKEWMQQLFGELPVAAEDKPLFLLVMGSAAVHVGVFPWGDDDAIINIRSYVVTDIEVVPELMSYLLHKNNDMRFGAFGIDNDNDIFFEHTICRAGANKTALKNSVMAVLSTADQLDDEIVASWGGRKATDK